jgi:Prokaryotic N-terminal methylation motif
LCLELTDHFPCLQSAPTLILPDDWLSRFLIRHAGCFSRRVVLRRLRKLLPPNSFEAGFTFVENLIAMVIVVLFFAALYGLNCQGLYLLNSGREALVANVCLRDRFEQLRNCTWAQLTDSTYLRTSVLNSSPIGAANLGNLTETLTINSYPTAGNPPISLTRTNGSASVITTNAAITNSTLVRVDATLSWTAAPGGRSRTQATSTLLAKYQ